jgi:hypothetical protein
MFQGSKTLMTVPLSLLYSVYCSTFYSLPLGGELTSQFEKLLVYQKSIDFADEVCSP